MTSTAVITGGGSGVGEQIAKKLDALGYQVAIVGRTKEKLDKVAGELTNDPVVIQADVSENSDRMRLVDTALEELGHVDALVNNAGIAIYEQIHKHSPADMEQLFRINGFAPCDLSRRFIPGMLDRKSGVIVSIASMANIDPFPGLGMYGCAKGALSVLPKAIVNEYGKKGIRAYTICPGAIETSMLRSMFSEKALPASQTLDASDVADKAVAFVQGECEEESGAVFAMPSH